MPGRAAGAPRGCEGRLSALEALGGLVGVDVASRHVDLRPPAPATYEAVHRLLNGPGAGTWRFRGRFIPSRDVEHVLADADLTRVVTAAGDGRVVALCQLHDLQPLDRHAQLSVLAAEPDDPFGLAAEGAIVFMHEAFVRFDLRKLYCHLSDSSMAATGAVLRQHASVEGRLVDHVRLDGRWQDVTILALTPDGLASLLRRPGLARLARPRRLPETGGRGEEGR